MRAPRRRPLLSSICATLVVVAGLATVSVVASPQASAAVTDIKINEVSSNPSDFVELKNTGASAVDVGGLRFQDNDPTHDYVIPSGTTIAAGGYLVLEESGGTYNFGFGLGSSDTANLFAADGTTVIDSYSWTGHRTPSYGRCADGTGVFTLMSTTSKGAANVCPTPFAGVKINEVSSNPSDFVELKNTGASAVDVGGLRFQDNDPTHDYVIPSGTTIAAGGYLVLEESGGTYNFGFGLGSNDTANLFAADGTTVIDSYSWTGHRTPSYGRCADGTGVFTLMSTTSKGAANVCAPPTTGGGIVFNEVESNGDAIGDFAEVVNTSSTAIDISGWKFTDSEPERDGHIYSVPAGTVVAPGAYYVFAEAAFGFGLGAPDGVRLLLADGTTLVDSYSWTAHALPTYGRCPDRTGPITTTTASTRGAANDCRPPVKINEVESDGGSPDDWIELVNNGAATADVSGFVVKDSGEPGYVLPAGTTIAAGGYLVVERAQLGSGLAGSDSARLFAADGTLIDSYTWAVHATVTYGRCPNGTGDFTTTQVSTKGAANNCPGDIVAGPWPGGQGVTTVDPQNTFQSNLSGLMYEPSGTEQPGSIWAVRNGPGALYELTPTATGYAPSAEFATTGKLLRYPSGTGDVDAEGVTFTDAGPDAGIYVASERNNSANSVSRPAILRFDPAGGSTELSAQRDWNLSADLPGLGANLGLEAIAWVPDSYLTAQGLVDQSTGTAYTPSDYPGHGTGLFFVGVEQTGRVYAYALDQDSDSFTRVASFASGFAGVMELYFEPETQQLWVVCDDTCQGRSARFDVDATGAFAPTAYYERPTGMPNLNNEGFTLAPRAECAAGLKPAFWADDSSTGGFAVRQGTVSCTPRTAQTVTFTSSPPTSPVVGTTYDVAATGGASGDPVTFSVATPSVCSVVGSTVTFARAGTCTVVARQAGDADYLPGSATQDVVVGQAPQSILFTSTPPAAPTIGSTYDVAATGGASGNPVTFSVTTPAVCSVSGATVTLTHAGTCVILAQQAGSADYLTASASQAVTVARAAQAVSFTSDAPESPVVGQTYPVAATGGDSGNPVTFAADSDACTVSGSTVTIVAPGRCAVVAAQAGDDDYLAASPMTQSTTAVRASTTLTLSLSATALRATVAVVAPGRATVTGEVSFIADDVLLGTAPVVDGVATLSEPVPPGRTRSVRAVYSGSALLTSSVADATRRDPVVTATLTSAVPQSESGWWTAPVTVTFTCTPQGSPVVSCPEPVVLDGSGTDLGVTREAIAQDGGVGTAVVSGVRIDLDAPSVRVAGVRDGAGYLLDGPTPSCVASDAVSGVDSCTLVSTRSGQVTTVTATAVDVAGNASSTSVTWRRPTLRIDGALRVTDDGRYVVERGDTYRVVALLPASPAPRTYGPLAIGTRPAGAGAAMSRGDTAGGLTTWTRTIRVTGRATDQKIVVRAGGRDVVVRLGVR